MNKPGAVVGCMSCGALYSAGPSDEGLCSKCSGDLAPELPQRTQTHAAPSSASRAGAPPSAARPGAPSSAPRINTPPQMTSRASPPPRASTPRSSVVTALRPRLRRMLDLRPIIKGAVVVALLGGAVAFVMPQRSRTEAWTQVQRGSLSGAWTSLRRHGLPGAWAAAQRHASEAWVAVRSRIPLGDAATKATASANLSSQKRGQPGTSKGTSKRGKHELSAVSSTP
jgi:hypothetical protein